MADDTPAVEEPKPKRSDGPDPKYDPAEKFQVKKGGIEWTKPPGKPGE